jgi:hypothetical protein
MPEIAEQDARDVALYRAWVSGARRRDLADQYQMSRQGVDKVISRVASALPPVDKTAEVHRAIELCEDMLAVWAPDAHAKNAVASREARGWASLLIRAGGLDRREVNVHVEHEGTVHHEPVPTVTDVLAQMWENRGDHGRAEQIRAELTRLDQPGAGP